MAVWVDRETGLPVTILLEVSASEHTISKDGDWFEFSDFVWNESFDPGLFSLEVPNGYHSYDEVGRPDDGGNP